MIVRRQSSHIASEEVASQLAYIDRRLSEIEAKVGHLPGNDFQRQELLDESAALAATRRSLDHKLKALLGQDDPAERQRREQRRARVAQLRQARAESYRNECERQAAALEQAGDHRNARLHRLEALRAYRIAEHEIHD